MRLRPRSLTTSAATVSAAAALPTTIVVGPVQFAKSTKKTASTKSHPTGGSSTKFHQSQENRDHEAPVAVVTKIAKISVKHAKPKVKVTEARISLKKK